MTKSPLALAICTAVLATAAMAQTDKPVLNVLTYDSFTSEWGPGPLVEKTFEAQCGCDLVFSAVGDGAELLARLQLEGKNSTASVVLGLDSNLITLAAATGLFTPHGQNTANDLPVPFADPLFLPYDWGWFAVVYDKTKLPNAPDSFEALAASDLKIVIQDPRSSTPGLGLLLWVKAAYGDRAPEIWSALADNILTVTPGWTEAYGMFTAGEADMVLSYTTSPAYHLIAEGDDSKAAAAFTEGHYLQVEVAGKLSNAPQPELADQFLMFVGSDAFQSIIPTTNWMYPAHHLAAGLPKGFQQMITPKKSLLMTPDEAATARKPALDEWLTALSR
ncbi:thiamine ABC transporter substrate binding subunit [Pseudorhodobacter sp.]|uniref:thiamine ABC transporter substrate binding subunit n=1 Tax=Pseudorhodobacter sp. TaxID=1934400 RepID=UPI002649FD4B|nr:thiamine ABC transporter substrate binding subunit [Pseudorhodobacter sp.]MDN5786863.1 thiamine ABC transporter substrate binding subunit [Pseudorhodobacter sp.]